MLLALSGMAAPADVAEGPSWLSDYGKAVKLQEREQKPMAVFLCPGKADKLCRDGSLNGEARKALADGYVCCHIDTATEEGKSLAREFGLSGSQGLVISDRTGQLQALRHEGDVSSAELGRYLQRYSNPDVAVRTTETNGGSRISYYGPDAGGGLDVRTSYYSGGPAYAPAPYPYFGGMGGGYCPTCSGCAGGRCRR
jgi:hypothetical protein